MTSKKRSVCLVGKDHQVTKLIMQSQHTECYLSVLQAGSMLWRLALVPGCPMRGTSTSADADAG